MHTENKIAIVGPGNVGRTMAFALQACGFRVTEIVARDAEGSKQKAAEVGKKVNAKAETVASAMFDAELIWLCVSDGAIAEVAKEMAQRAIDWKGKVIFHASAALASSELKPLHEKGAAVGSLHPMNTFVIGAEPDLKGTPFAAEGEHSAVGVMREVASRLNQGGPIFSILARDKVLYHCVGSFTSPMLISLLNIAERTAKAAGVDQPRELMRVILQRTIENYLEKGTEGAFSGPLRRGDVATVEKHVSELSRVPGALEVYRSLGENALDHLPVKNAEQLREALASRKK